MAVFDFLKKKERYNPSPMPSPPIAPQGVPTEQVIFMRQQGLTNNQIITTLQRQGFTSAQIFDAMSQSDIKSGVTGAPPAATEPVDEFAPPTADYGGRGMESPLSGFTGAPAPPQAPQMQMQQSAPSENFEEIAESIIEEKWKGISSEFDKMKAWKDSVNERLDKLEQSVTDIRSDIENLHKAIVAKIGEYDKNLLSVGTEIKAMEKVFSKVLPTFTENVSELSRTVRNIKAKVPVKK
jgi:uncharacterized protein YhaN